MQKKKIDFIIGSLGRGGAERVISILANFYAQENFDVNIVFLLGNEVSYKISETIKITPLYGTTKSYLRRIPYWLRNLKRHFMSRKPDYIVSFVCRINLLTIMSFRKCKKKLKNTRLIISERNDPRYDGRGALAKFISKIIYPHANEIIFQTEIIKSMFPKHIQSMGSLILNPVSISTKPISPSKRKNIVISSGRLAKQKNQLLLIDAFADVVSLPNLNHYELHIYGDGPLRDELNSHINKLGLSNKIFIFPSTSKIHEKVANAKLFVLSSLFEGLSNSLMEAIALGLPVISTPVSGANDLIIDGINGFVLNSFGKEELSMRIVEILTLTDKEYEKYSENSKTISKKFDVDTILKQYNSIIIGEK